MNELHYQVDLLKAMNQKLSEKERMYRLMFQTTDGAYLYFSYEKKQIVTLGKWHSFFDFEIQEPRDFSRLLDAVEEPYLLSLQEALSPEKRNEETASVECPLKGKKVWLLFRIQVFYNNGQPTDKVITVENNTKAHSQKEELSYMAYYDALTGLYNRNYFIKLLSEYVDQASKTNNTVSVMLFDIDNFRNINDGMGMVVGDELVQQFGLFLNDLCGEDMIGCHLHTDVYAIAIYNPSGSRTPDYLYREIRKRLREPFHISTGQNVRISVCVGVAEYPAASSSPLELMNCAEIVVYKCKEAGGDNMQYFTSKDQESFVHAIELEEKINQAIHNQDFVLYYQPQYYTGNRKLRGVEALIRWWDKDGGIISPDTFIPVAEKNGSIVPLGKWVVEESVRQYAVWRKQFGFPFVLSINISALQYKKDDFEESIMSVLNKYQVRPSEIELEITESILIDDFQAVTEKLKVLRGHGIRISLDDFGTGFSSLSYLKKFPIDTLKIDKSFINTVVSDSVTRVITESIVHMVKALGFESIAEGVEDEQQYKYLHAIGCDVIQGYLFSRPLPPEQFESLFLSGGKDR